MHVLSTYVVGWANVQAAPYLGPMIREDIPGFKFRNSAKYISEFNLDLDKKGQFYDFTHSTGPKILLLSTGITSFEEYFSPDAFKKIVFERLQRQQQFIERLRFTKDQLTQRVVNKQDKVISINFYKNEKFDGVVF